MRPRSASPLSLNWGVRLKIERKSWEAQEREAKRAARLVRVKRHLDRCAEQGLTVEITIRFQRGAIDSMREGVIVRLDDDESPPVVRVVEGVLPKEHP